MSILHDQRREPRGFGDGNEWFYRAVRWKFPEEPDKLEKPVVV